MKKTLTFFAALCLVSGPALAGESPSPAGAEVYFVNLEDGQTVSSPFTVVFGLKGMGVAPAGVDNEAFENIGHHHLLINAELTPDITESGIPADENYVHFGKGQTETTLDLPSGDHKLQLVFADPAHVPHNPVVASDTITIHVQ